MNKRSETKNGDERYTSLETYSKCIKLAEKIKVDLDVAASRDWHFATEYYTKKDDGLSKPWSTLALGPETTVWCNPPWSDIGPWVKKAWDSIVSEECNTIIMLVPNNRQGTRWWQDLVEPFRDGRGTRRSVTLDTHNLPGRPKYGTPEDPSGINQKSPPFGSMILLWKRTNERK